MKELIELMDAGLTCRAIAEKLGLTRSNATNLCQQERMRRRELLSHIDTEHARRAYIDEAMDLKDVADLFACSVAYMQRYLHAFGIFRDAGHQVRAGARKVWNDGLTKETNETLARLAKAREGEGNPMAGRVAWNAGLTANDNQVLAETARKLRGRKIGEAVREKMAEAKRGKRGDETNRWKGGHSTTAGYLCQSARNIDPRSASKTDPSFTLPGG